MKCFNFLNNYLQLKMLLDYYITKKFFTNFLFIIISFTVIFIVVDIIDNIDKFINRGIANNEIINYYLLSIPWYISIALPMTILISTIICFVTMQKSHELTALKASGVSIFRTSSYLLISSIALCFFSFFFDNIIVVNAFEKRIPIEKKMNKKLIKSSKQNNIYYHLENAFLAIKRFNFNTNSGTNISIQKLIGPDIKYRIDADRMSWNEEKNMWLLKNLKIRYWDEGNLNYYFLKDSTLAIKDITPSIIKKDNINPEEMNYWQLSYFVKKLKNKGLNYTRWSVNKHFKTAFACTPFIMMIFGIALSITKPRSSHTAGIGLGIVVIFLYYLLIKTGQTLGYNQILSPFLSVWFVNILFVSFGSYLFIKSRT